EISPLNILVAEDNLVNQKIIKKILLKLGHEVDLAENGEIAFQMRKTNGYDLILMDLQMPVIDGRTSSKLIRDYEVEKGFTKLPIIALTANATVEDRNACYEVGMNDFMTKPVDIKTLKEKLFRWGFQDNIPSH
ncbi:MAG: response regulator, partial [Bacteroidota bacterium]